jgi:outer membrane receptor for ferrienterochelin and colicin
MLLLAAEAPGGTTGIIEGVVLDGRTGERLPAVNVFCASLGIGTSTNVEGMFAFHNVRIGVFELRFTHVGYQSYLLKNVTVYPDLRTRLRVALEPGEVRLDEVVVVQEKPLIQTDVTATSFLVSGEELRALPITQPMDIVGYKPGTTLEGNVRGGKSTEVSYLVDGLPVQELMRGDVTASLPLSSIVGMSIHTGGFEAQYGNALSGIVNIVTRTGGNEFTSFARASSDHLFGGTQQSKQSEFEASLSGPIVRDRCSFLVAGSGVLSGTRWWQDMQTTFVLPVDRRLNGFGKLEYIASPSLRLGLQVLSSDRDWRDYEFAWRYNLPGLPPERRTSHRVALTASQSAGQDFYYTASLSWYTVRARIGEGDRGAVLAQQPYEYDFYLRSIISGNRSWLMDARQNTYTLKVDASHTAWRDHLVKFGIEFNQYDLASDLVKLEPRMTYFGKPLINEPQLDFSSRYAYRPRTGSLYVQDKIDFLKEGILLTLGLRYDFLDPRAGRPAIEASLQGDTAYAITAGAVRRATFKHQISPRFGAAMPVMEKGIVFFNLGWYFQHPLFDYLYTGIDRVALGRGVSALTGNPDLEPELSMAWEASFKYSLPVDMVASIAYFKKESTNLTDSKTFVPGDSKLAGSFGYAEFVNNPYASVYGVEVTLTRERGAWVTGEISYTYMVAEGTTGSAYDGYYIAQYGLPPARRIAPLSWDQRHTFKLQTTVSQPRNFSVSLFLQHHSGRPYTAYPTSTGFEPVVGGFFVLNNARMREYTNIDLRAEKHFPLSSETEMLLTLFIDVRNLANARNVAWVDSNGRIGGELSDPSGYYIGRRTSAGLQFSF